MLTESMQDGMKNRLKDICYTKRQIEKHISLQHSSIALGDSSASSRPQIVKFLSFVELEEIILYELTSTMLEVGNVDNTNVKVRLAVLFLKCFSGQRASCLPSKHSPSISVTPSSQESQSSYCGPPQVRQAR